MGTYNASIDEIKEKLICFMLEEIEGDFTLGKFIKAAKRAFWFIDYHANKDNK